GRKRCAPGKAREERRIDQTAERSLLIKNPHKDTAHPPLQNIPVDLIWRLATQRNSCSSLGVCNQEKNLLGLSFCQVNDRGDRLLTPSKEVAQHVPVIRRRSKFLDQLPTEGRRRLFTRPGYPLKQRKLEEEPSLCFGLHQFSFGLHQFR